MEILHCVIINYKDWAVLNNQSEIILLLLNINVDVSLKNINGKTASEEAFDRGQYDISEKISEKEPNNNIIEDNEEEVENN